MIVIALIAAQAEAGPPIIDIYGEKPCPKNSQGIVICDAERPERYRIPKDAKSPPPGTAPEAIPKPIDLEGYGANGVWPPNQVRFASIPIANG